MIISLPTTLLIWPSSFEPWPAGIRSNGSGGAVVGAGSSFVDLKKSGLRSGSESAGESSRVRRVTALALRLCEATMAADGPAPTEREALETEDDEDESDSDDESELSELRRRAMKEGSALEKHTAFPSSDSLALLGLLDLDDSLRDLALLGLVVNRSSVGRR